MSLREIDTAVFLFINRSLQNSIFDVSMPIITDKYYFLILVLMAFMVIRDKKSALVPILLAIISVALSDWISNGLKHVIERPRPYYVLESVRLLVGRGDSFSMPSNHAANASAVILALSYQSAENLKRFNRWMLWMLLAIALLVGFSRIYIGVHYLSDVIIGAFVGISVSAFVISLYKRASSRYQSRPHNTLLLISILFFSLLRIFYITQNVIDLSPDEAHYWEWSRRLDLSYYSKGPMIAYLIAFGTAVFGDNVFGIRIMAVIFSALSSVLIYMLGKRFFDERTGTAAAILMQVVPLYSAYGVLFSIDSPFIFFWVLSLLLFWEAIKQGLGVRCYWILLGISVGLGLLTKYTMGFFYICALLFVLNSKEYKKLLFSKWPYISAALSLIVFSPVIVWNAKNNWVTFRHTAGQAHVSEGFNISIVSFAEFFGSQLAIITPLLLVLIVYSAFKFKKERNGDFLFWFSVPVILFFLLKSIQGKVQANWALPGYITGLLAFSALFTGSWFNIKKWVKGVVIAGIILSLSATAVAYLLPVLKLPPKIDPSSRIRGWKELGPKASRLSDELSRKGPVFIFSDRYQVSSELAFYMKGHPVTYCVNLGRRMNQYDLWPGFNSLIHYNAIFVTIEDARMPAAFVKGFDSCDKEIFSAYNTAGGILRNYSIFTCYNFKGMQQEGMITY